MNIKTFNKIYNFSPGLNSEFGDFVSTSPNPVSVPSSAPSVSESSPGESGAKTGVDGKMSNSSILALFGPMTSPAPAAVAQSSFSSSMFGSLPTQQPQQQQFGGLGGLQMTSFGAAPQPPQQQQFGGFPQKQQQQTQMSGVAQAQHQQFGQFQAVNPPQQQNFGAGLISQEPPAFNAAPSSQQNSELSVIFWKCLKLFILDMFDMFSSKPGQINNHPNPANNPFLDANQV